MMLSGYFLILCSTFWLASVDAQTPIVCDSPNPHPEYENTCPTGGQYYKTMKEQMLKFQNEKRRMVLNGQAKYGNSQNTLPIPVEMPDLKWDDNLAKLAQDHADQCDFSHFEFGSTCQKVKDAGFTETLGQNVAQVFGSVKFTTPLYEYTVNGWYNEINVFSPGSNNENIKDNKFSEATGHLTQLIWAKTTHVGCGYKCYKDEGESNTKIQYKIIITCNYFPAGNFKDESVYKINGDGSSNGGDNQGNVVDQGNEGNNVEDNPGNVGNNGENNNPNNDGIYYQPNGEKYIPDSNKNNGKDNVKTLQLTEAQYEEFQKNPAEFLKQFEFKRR